MLSRHNSTTTSLQAPKRFSTQQWIGLRLTLHCQSQRRTLSSLIRSDSWGRLIQRRPRCPGGLAGRLTGLWVTSAPETSCPATTTEQLMVSASYRQPSSQISRLMVVLTPHGRTVTVGNGNGEIQADGLADGSSVKCNAYDRTRRQYFW